MRFMILAVVASLVFANCADLDDDGLFADEGSSTTQQQITDSQTEEEEYSSLACDHFRNVAGDWDILTPEEKTRKLKEVHNDSAIATPAVKKWARAMVKHWIQFNDAKLARAVNNMGKACSEAGH